MPVCVLLYALCISNFFQPLCSSSHVTVTHPLPLALALLYAVLLRSLSPAHLFPDHILPQFHISMGHEDRPCHTAHREMEP